MALTNQLHFRVAILRCTHRGRLSTEPCATTPRSGLSLA